MDEKRPGNENPEAGGGGGGGSDGECTNLDLPLPGKDLLEHVIDVLQREKKDFSGKPVNPKEVPIDFGTIRSKVQDGIYNNLNKFESDILLILNNAMITTLPDTDYFNEVQAINDLAKRVFIKLKTDPNGLKSEFPSKRSKRGQEPGDKAGSSSTKPGPNRKRRVGNLNDQPQLSTEEFCEKYNLLSQVRRSPSRFSTPSESTPLEHTGCMPVPGIPLPTRQESQHQSAPHGQQGDTYPVDRGAPQQQRHCDDAGPLVQLTHQEPHHTSDPHVRPSGSNPVDQGQQSGIYAVNEGAPQRQRPFNDAGPWGRLTHQEPYDASHHGVRPSESDPVGWAEWKQYEQALTTLGQTGYMLMPPQLGILQHLLVGPSSQEPQHLSAPHGQQGDIYAVDQGTLRQQIQRDDAGPLIRLAHQEPHHTSDPRVRPSGSNPVDQGVRQEHGQALTTLGETGHMPMPARYGVPSNLHDAPTLQEPQHLSARHGQQVGIYAVKQSVPQQQRQFDDAGPRCRLKHQEPCHAPDPGVRPSESDPVGWAEWKEYEQALTTLGQTGYMPMPPQLGIPQHLLGAPASQEPQHLSAPHGQQGDIYAVDQGAPRQQRQRDDAGPLVRLAHQEPHHTSDPRVRPSGSNPVDQGVRQEHRQALTTLGQTGHMPMPSRYWVPSNLHDAPTLHEPQHLSARHGQQGGIYAVKQSVPQQHRLDDAGPWGRLTHQEPYHAPDPGVRPGESDPVGWAEWKEYEQALTTLGQTGYKPMKPQLGIQQHLLSAPSSQELQHLSAPHGQQGDIYAVDQGAPQQQRQRDDASQLVRLMHQGRHRTSDPRVRPSGSNPVVQCVRQKHMQALTTLGRTGHMQLPAWYGVMSNLHDAPTLQVPQHLSAPRGQHGGIYAVKQGASQQRQFDDAGPWGRLTRQEPYHAPDPGVRRSESDPVGWGVWHEQALPPEYAHKQDFPQGRRQLNQREQGQGPVGPGGSGAGVGNAYGGGALQGGEQQQQ
ncbi:hypothetical protein LguiB_030967 [Lonicera macranthoides]